ncbi:hypothetical protein [Natrinema halophilum]|uniref:Uncharacterized protein n=1 Tax=Natrinema halophilum TaxID=1699371 RepID=A0A7D5KH07_9EURY|nr:hypothetical protein [Natrinema halophilum]QLG47359.1 hypothetical protein HYG82_00130 [Natrinema halophilum]
MTRIESSGDGKRRRSRLSFGITSRYPGSSTIYLSYLLSLPVLAQPGQQQFEATWSSV